MCVCLCVCMYIQIYQIMGINHSNAVIMKKVFSVNSKLTPHLMVYTRECPYQCSQSGMAFSHDSHLMALVRHTGDKPYQWSHCDIAYTMKYKLKINMKIHTGYKLYQCNQCDKAFFANSNLVRHMRSHNGENHISKKYF